MHESIFPVLILNGRPASGKSEMLDYLRRLPGDVRRQRYHIGRMYELDDFPMLWAWFEEDDILEKELGRSRLHSTPDGYFVHGDLWHLLIGRLSLEYDKLRRDMPGLHDDSTVLIEFSRGSEHGGYAAAYAHLSDAVLRQAAALYIDVSYAESLRKNRRRFNPARPDSILQHGLSDAKLEQLYKTVDWEMFAAGDAQFLTVNGHRVPYVTLPNEDDVTTALGDVFERRLERAMQRLWANWRLLHP